MNSSVGLPQQKSVAGHIKTVSSWDKEEKTKRTHNLNYLCGDHDYLQNLQAQFPWDLVSGSELFTRVHEVEL